MAMWKNVAIDAHVEKDLYQKNKIILRAIETALLSCTAVTARISMTSNTVRVDFVGGSKRKHKSHHLHEMLMKGASELT